MTARAEEDDKATRVRTQVAEDRKQARISLSYSHVQTQMLNPRLLAGHIDLVLIFLP